MPWRTLSESRLRSWSVYRRLPGTSSLDLHRTRVVPEVSSPYTSLTTCRLFTYSSDAPHLQLISTKLRASRVDVKTTLNCSFTWAGSALGWLGRGGRCCGKISAIWFISRLSLSLYLVFQFSCPTCLLIMMPPTPLCQLLYETSPWAQPFYSL